VLQQHFSRQWDALQACRSTEALGLASSLFNGIIDLMEITSMHWTNENGKGNNNSRSKSVESAISICRMAIIFARQVSEVGPLYQAYLAAIMLLLGSWLANDSQISEACHIGDKAITDVRSLYDRDPDKYLIRLEHASWAYARVLDMTGESSRLMGEGLGDGVESGVG